MSTATPAQRVEVAGRYLERRFTYFAGQMSVCRARQVIDRGLLTKVRVDDDTEIFEFFENPVHRRRTDFGTTFLHGDGDLVGREVAARAHQHVRDDSLSDRDSFGGPTHHVQNGLLVIGSCHKQRLRPRIARLGRRGAGENDYNVASRASISSASCAIRRTISPAGTKSLMAPTA